MKELPLLASVAEVADYLGWTETKLRNRIARRKGHPPYVIADNCHTIEFRRGDVIDWYNTLTTVVPDAGEKPAKRVRTRAVRSKWPTVGQQAAGH